MKSGKSGCDATRPAVTVHHRVPKQGNPGCRSAPPPVVLRCAFQRRFASMAGAVDTTHRRRDATMDVMLFGASGMVGQGALRECLTDAM